MRQNASGGQVRPSVPNGPATNSLPSPNLSFHPTRPHLGLQRPLCPPQPQPLANGPVGPSATHGPSDSHSVGDSSKSSSSSSCSNNQPGPSDPGPNGDVPYLQPAGSGDAALLPHACTSTQTQDATPQQTLHLNPSQVRHRAAFKMLRIRWYWSRAFKMSVYFCHARKTCYIYFDIMHTDLC